MSRGRATLPCRKTEIQSHPRQRSLRNQSIQDTAEVPEQQPTVPTMPVADVFRYWTEPADVEKRCIFCKIARGEIPPGPRDGDHAGKSGLLFESPNVVAFSDIHPAAEVHLLVIPRAHIKNCLALTFTPELLQEMEAAGIAALRKHFPEHAQKKGTANDSAGDSGKPRMLFIRPPWNSVYHVHLHVFAGKWDPRGNNSFVRNLGFNNSWFHLTPQMVRRERGWEEPGGVGDTEAGPTACSGSGIPNAKL